MLGLRKDAIVEEERELRSEEVRETQDDEEYAVEDEE